MDKKGRNCRIHSLVQPTFTLRDNNIVKKSLGLKIDREMDTVFAAKLGVKNKWSY